MKKRLMSLLLMLALCLSLVPTSNIYAAEEAGVTSNQEETYFSQWAMKDLLDGETYDIFPQSWIYKGMTKQITQAQLRVLFAKTRLKLLKTEVVTEESRFQLAPMDKYTVEDVLNAFYGILSSYSYKEDIGLTKKYSPTAYMAEHGIFTGQEGELAYGDICTVEQACVIATRLITYVYDALDAASKGVFWEVKQGDNTVYLLGSIHTGNYDIYPFSNKMLEAFAKSDALVVELDILAANKTESVVDNSIYMDGTTLKDHISEDAYNKTIELAAALGIAEDAISQIKPWYLWLSFVNLGTTEEASSEEVMLGSYLGVDMKFLRDAYFYGKPILELEGDELQMQLLDSLSDELIELLLVDSIEAVIDVLSGNTSSATSESVDDNLDLWHKGDVEGLKKNISIEDEIPDALSAEDEKELKLYEEFIDKMLTKRDVGMADKIDQLLRADGSTTYFVVVGAFHYVSDYSVLDILEEKGYTITPIR